MPRWIAPLPLQPFIPERLLTTDYTDDTEHGAIIPGMTMDECVRAAGKPLRVLRNTDEQGHSIERWQYNAGWVYFEDGVVRRVQRMMGRRIRR